MALSVVGRLVLSSIGITRLYGLCQDPNNNDAFYCLQIKTGTLWLYKITWPDVIEELVDTGVAFNNSQQDCYNAVIGDSWVYGLGQMDATNHYAVAIGGAAVSPFVTGATIIDVDLSDYSVTTYSWAGAPNATFGWTHLKWGYDSVGSYFAMGSATGAIMKKNWGIASGTTYDPGGDTKPWLVIDDQSWANWRASPTEAWYKITHTGTVFAEALITTGTTYLPKKATIGATITHMDMGRSSPGKAVSWDDEWQYMIWSCRYTGGAGSDCYQVAVRKNLGSGSYSYKILNPDGDGNYEHKFLFDAMDIWQTGNTGEAGTVRKIWFTAGGFRDKLFCSDAWPMSMDNYVTLDDGGSSAITTPWVATSGEFCYVYHVGGTNYPTCISKVCETELISGAAEAAVSAVGSILLWLKKRVFFAGVASYLRYLWWSQPFEPQSLDVGWDGYNTTVFDSENIVALVNIEDSVYIGAKKGWMRLRGSSPDHWLLDSTLGTSGPLSNKTVASTPFGAIYPRQDGLYLFNGFSTRLIFEQGKELMSQPNWDSLSKMFCLWDGRYFRFFYPNGSATSNDRELIVDFIGGPESPRGTEADRAAASGWADLTTNTIYLGDENGNIWTEGGGTDSRDLEITTKEYPAQGLIQAGQFAKLHYDLDAAGATVQITPIYDGVAQTAISIPTNSTRTRGNIQLPKGNAFRVGFKITVSTAAAVKIYEPWVLE